MCSWLHAWSATCLVSLVWLATCVLGYMCGLLHAWSATCLVSHVWLATCVVGYMCSKSINVNHTKHQASVKSPNGFGVSVQVSVENSNKPYYTPYSE